MQKLVDLLNSYQQKYADELFYCEGEFFVIADGKIAKNPDFMGDFDGIYKLSHATEGFICSYIVANNLDANELIDRLDTVQSELETGGDEIPDGLDYDTFNFLISCQESGITPYCAYKALGLILSGVQSGFWHLLGYDGQYKNVFEYMSEACEVIDFRYTDEWDDEYWQSIIENLPSYIFDGGEKF